MSAELESPGLLARLRDDLGRRRIRRGIAALEELRPAIENLAPVPGAGILAGLVAQWVDAGFDSPALLDRLLARFPAALRAGLPLIDYLHLRMAEAVAALWKEDLEGAGEHLRLVLSFEGVVEDPEIFAIANFWMGRSLRKRGRYDEALAYTTRGEHLALSLGYREMAAIMQVTLSWLAFQKGKLHDAAGILRRAAEALAPTDDFLSRGNIQSAYGRIARRQGKYELAVECFERAICEFRRGGVDAPALARTLVNLAFVKRLLAVRAQKELDHVAAVRRGKPGLSDPAPGQRSLIERIRGEARARLDEAEQIYSRRQNHSGLAGVRTTRGYLHLDAGDLERASIDAADAFSQGSTRSDAIAMARARILECVVQIAAIEEQVGDPAQHREAAETAAREAVEFAGRTENRRLLARALVWQGLAAAAEPADREAARRCCEQAMTLLQPEGPERQCVWEDLETLKARVLHTQPVDAVLRRWSAGIVEGRSFQQMTEEFARIVIPRVWDREGRKVSRVAEKLSISPKKVRRILHAAGFGGQVRAEK